MNLKDIPRSLRKAAKREAVLTHNALYADGALQPFPQMVKIAQYGMPKLTKTQRKAIKHDVYKPVSDKINIGMAKILGLISTVTATELP